jgi:cellulose synthase/poly-beta-1,6-N-acetylglucosamine synthase-like glycosyltransferase
MSWFEQAYGLLIGWEWIVLGYFLLVNSYMALLLISAAWETWQNSLRSRWEARWRVQGSSVAPTLSMLVPAYNESATILQSVQALLALYYPNLEVVVVNDGSKDDTLSLLIERFELVRINPIYQQSVPAKPARGLYRSRTHPNLLVVDKENGGRSDALNAAINLATGELVCAIDADTIIEPEGLERLVRPFLTGGDVVAAGGTIRPVNGCIVQRGRVVSVHAPTHALAGIQVVEYIRAFLFGRVGWNKLGGNLIVSGAFGMFRRDALVAKGGYEKTCICEDMEVVVGVRRLGHEQGRPQRVVYIPDPVGWTEVPESTRVLGRQRDRWHNGLTDVIWRHHRVLFNPSYGAMGMVVFPYFLLVEWLGPFIEALGLLILPVLLLYDLVNLRFAILFFLLAYGYGLILSISGLLLEEFSFHRHDTLRDRAVLVIWTLLETFGYRQLTVYWRIRGAWNFFLGRSEWGAMERRGFTTSAAG